MGRGKMRLGGGFGLSSFVVVTALATAAPASPALAQSATQTRLWALPNPSTAGRAVTLRAEVDGLGGGAPTGALTFTEGATTLGTANLGKVGAGQATIGAGGAHSCALSQTGGLKCWGDNLYGEIGDGTIADRSTPVDVPGLASGVIAVATGDGHTCALTQTGGVKCWGDNSDGEVGNGTASLRQMTPVAVTGLTSGVIAIAAGGNHSCAITSKGLVKCWGYNASGQLGDGTTTTRLTPVIVAGLSGVVAIALGDSHSCALTRNNALKCWGRNVYGQLGDGTTTDRASPVDVVGLASGAAGVALGYTHSCAVTRAGAAKCWGFNAVGQLGDASAVTRWTPADVFGLTRGVATVDVGSNHSCALMRTGGVKCWGENGQAQLGDTTTLSRNAPVDVYNLASGAVAIAAGARHSCALISTQNLKCWGTDSDYQLGIGYAQPHVRTMPVNASAFAGLIRARASFVTPPLAAGAHTLTATYPGDAKHLGSGATMVQTAQ